MTPKQIEANRPAFEAWFTAEYQNRLNSSKSDQGYSGPHAYATWIGWKAAKADTLAQAVAPDPVRLTDVEIQDLAHRTCTVYSHVVQVKYHFAPAELLQFAHALHTKSHAPDGWIACADRLPKPFDEVMIWPHPSHMCMTAEVDNKGGWGYQEYELNYGWVDNKMSPPTHWMPLPTAPLTLAPVD